MKHSTEDYKTKLRAIHLLAEKIKEGMKTDTVEPHVIIMLAEQIQQDALLLEEEE